MIIKVLIFLAGMEKDSDLPARLKNAGYRICVAKTLSRLHIVLSSCRPDAVLVSEEYLADHGLVPTRHLWDFRSYLTIISIKTENGATSGIISRKKDTPLSPEAEEKINMILNTIGKDSAKTPESIPDIPDKPVKLPVDFTPVLHRKMKCVLDFLVAAGARGASTRTLSEAVWGSGTPERKKDIQIYITRLRRCLEEIPGRPLKIIFSAKTYFLVNTK